MLENIKLWWVSLWLPKNKIYKCPCGRMYMTSEKGQPFCMVCIMDIKENEGDPHE